MTRVGASASGLGSGALILGALRGLSFLTTFGRGFGLATLLRDDTPRRTAIVARWSLVLDAALREGAPAGP